MSFTVKVKGQDLPIKFNYRMVFKANKKLGSINSETKERNADGAGVLFAKVLEQDDEALFEIINLAATKDLTENEIFEAIEDFFSSFDDEEKAYDAIFDQVKDEMLESGFFKKKIKKYVENLEKAIQVLQKKNTDESKNQVEAIQELAEKMKKEIS
ncbi:tail assembly chaperone [Enterococcus sp. DIV0800]|uniref:tail assembly chaperone n=1 Tax=unclassified Enterococcus TaxID=2608891 RepID=UPI003D2FF07D